MEHCKTGDTPSSTPKRLLSIFHLCLIALSHPINYELPTGRNVHFAHFTCYGALNFFIVRDTCIVISIA